MFACVYAEEDNTLTVVGKKSKRLELLGEFAVKENVTLKWGKELYTGTIVKIGDDDNDLTDFATKAHNKFLKNLKNKDNLPDGIFDFDHKRKVLGKRQPVQTEKIKASKEQEKDFASGQIKKKKSEDHAVSEDSAVTLTAKPLQPKAKTKNITPKSAENKKKQSEAATSIVVNQEMIDVINDSPTINSSIEDQFPLILKENEVKEKCKIADTPLSATWSICRSANRTLSPTNEDINTLHSGSVESESLPAPPAAVLSLLEIMMEPEVQDYLKRFIHFHNRERTLLTNEPRPSTESKASPGDSQTQYDALPSLHRYPKQRTAPTPPHPSLQINNFQNMHQERTRFYTQADVHPMPQQPHTQVDVHPMPQQPHTQVDVHPMPQQPHTQVDVHPMPQQPHTQVDVHPMPQQPHTQVDVHPMPQQPHTQVDVHPMPQQPHTQVDVHPMPQQPHTQVDVHPMPQQPHTQVDVHPMPQQPHTQVDVHPMPQQPHTQHMVQDHCTEETSQKQNDDIITSIPSPYTPTKTSQGQVSELRRSPRKHITITPDTPQTFAKKRQSDSRKDDTSEEVRLLATSDITVNLKGLKKATSAAAKAQDDRAAFTLTSKLLPLLFSNEELAASRGQGIRAKKSGDLRPTLDTSRVQFLKEPEITQFNTLLDDAPRIYLFSGKLRHGILELRAMDDMANHNVIINHFPPTPSCNQTALDLTAPATDALVKNRKNAWIQLAGHPGTFAPAGPNTIWKRRITQDNTETKAYESLMTDTAHDCVPVFYREVIHNGDYFIEMEDLLQHFTNPNIMDIKIGKRTFLESEVKNPLMRKDLYEKMVELDPDATTQDENEARAVRKLRYMQFREQESSTSTYGFRIEAIRRAGEPPVSHLKKIKSRHQIVKVFKDFLLNNEEVRCLICDRLRYIREKVESSPFFRSHELIGSSALVIFDEEGQAGVWMIDFSKAVSAEESLTHRKPWILGNHEDGYLTGLDNLIEIMEELKLSDPTQESNIQTSQQDG